MKFLHLLAKSAENPKEPLPAQTLVGHTHAVLDASDALLEVITQPIIDLLGSEITEETWRNAVTCAAFPRRHGPK